MESKCDHKWVHLSTHYDRYSYNRYGDPVIYARIDRFFCEKCCEQRDAKHEETVCREDDAPIWWRH